MLNSNVKSPTNLPSTKFKSSSMETIDSLTKSLGSPTSPDLRKLKQATEDFEQIFVNMMLKEMNKGLGKTGFLDGGDYEKAFKDMLVDERAKQMSKNGSFGLAKMMYKQLEQHVMAPLTGSSKSAKLSVPIQEKDAGDKVSPEINPSDLARQIALEKLTYDYRRPQGNQK